MNKKQNTLQDYELIIRIKAGDEDSFKELFLRYYPRFRHFILRFIANSDVADDLLQNVFMKIWSTRASMREELSVTAYIYVFVKYEIFNYLRLKSTRFNDRFNDAVHANIMSTPGVDSNYDYIELEEAVNKSIASMPDKRRRIFCLNRYEFKSAKEIAEILGLSVRTVEKHIELALRTLRKDISSALITIVAVIAPWLH
ncbi:MAG: RNA polymerase sigma-70 factor [Bacteroidales bacterium]|nr:RNA polymerase sigma-70 factor [Bacteroidales bacterium]